MTASQKAQRVAVGFALDKILNYVDKDPQANLIKLVGLAEKLVGGTFPKKNFDFLRASIADPENVWNILAQSVLADVDRRIVKNMLLAFGLGAGYYGTTDVRTSRETSGCNIPWIILLDPTSACNLKCKGCWSAQYGHSHNLSAAELESVVSQGVEMGTHVYMFTGGEPLIRKDDILSLCENHPDCVFLCYTNGTLVDEAFCKRVVEVGNLTLALSIEGTPEINDSRRGEGNYDAVMKAMELLKKHKCFFGISVCYTRQNIPVVTSDDFIDLMIEKGVKYAWFFNYMPVGKDALPELIPTTEQRTQLYKWLRQVRGGDNAKPLLLIDFQNDAEFVGGCIAGGRNYFHINSAGDIEPCVFIHFSDSNIRTHTLLEALKNPLFQAFWRNQPFNDNHLRPCPMLENPNCLRAIIAETGAKSTNLEAPEDVETLCSRCDAFAEKWAVEGQELWDSTKHPNPKTQYYRDLYQEKT